MYDCGHVVRNIQKEKNAAISSPRVQKETKKFLINLIYNKMATIKQGILGGFSGKVGSVVGTSWKGIGVMKAMPLSVANPKTSSQVNNRDRNTGVLRLAQGIGTTFIRTYWNRFAKGMSGFNDFMSVNYACYNPATQQYDQTKMFASVGKLVPMSITTASVEYSGACSLSFPARSTSSDYVAGDLVDVAVFNKDKQEGVVHMGVVATATTATFNIPANWQADEECIVFLSCRRGDGTAVSTSDSYNAVIAL